MLFVLHLKSAKSVLVVRPICSSLISLNCGARALFLPGFYTNKFILLYHNRDIFTAAFTYYVREAF